MTTALERSLKRSYKFIKKSLGEGDPNLWVADNFYIIHKHYKAVISCKNALKCHKMYQLLSDYCRKRDYAAEKTTLVDFLLGQSKHFSYIELASVKSLLAAVSINAVAKMLKSKETTLLPNGIKLLISLSHPQFDDITSNVWVAEKSIARFEEDYDRFDDETKEKYRQEIAEYAQKKHISETDAVKELISTAKSRGCPLGRLLFKPKRKYRVLWYGIIAVLFSLLALAGYFAVGWIWLLLAVPFAMAAVSVADQITAFFVPPYRAPRIKLDAVPKDAKTLVTVAALMNGGKNDGKIFDQLEKFSYMNPDKGIYFCLLADFADSAEQYHSDDSEIINNAYNRIDELNRIHGERFCILFRERVFNKSENRYGGWERKRGAVCRLVSHIVKGNATEYHGGAFIRDIKYILTLDSDTNLSVGSVRELLSIALHPVNRPVIKNARVKAGFGIIQPTVKTELSSAYKSGFSRLTSGAGGADIYASASFHRSQCLFGSGNFCGKGLIDVNCFYRLVEGRLPEGLVLSHDSVEGSILNTVCVSDITLTDSTPANTVSFFRRHHRWMRGDFQNLYFLRGRLLSAFGKWRLLLTVLRHSSPLFSVAAICAGAFLSGTSGGLLFSLAYSEFLLPCLITAVRFLMLGSPFAVIRFFSKAYSLLFQTFIRLTFEISSSARRAALVVNAYFRSLIRLFTRQKTLEWTTAAQTEKLASSLGKFVLDGVSSVAIGIALLIFALPPWVRFCGLLYFVYPLISVVISRPLNGGGQVKVKLTDEKKTFLTEQAKDMLEFYQANINEGTHFLPPDNIQFSPVRSVAMRTSPTNMGFYLVALLAARDLEIIDSPTLYNKLESTLTVIEGLDKYKGNLYNWYDLNDLSVIGDRYVSTVDSGNFLVMLVALKEGIKEYSSEHNGFADLALRCEKIIDGTDLTSLYDNRRHLFKIGLTPGKENSEGNYYDLLMSECRMTGYFAIARGAVPKKHWQSLGRMLTHQKGYLGLLSWSGTAFEYLMPQLFLPLYRDSFMFESIAFASMVQRDRGQIWGISESGFYSFDSEMNYQYKANGLQPLALRRISEDENIISPYSGYLSLCICPNAAIKNLKALESKGMYGKYGLYEALDLNNNSGGLCVKSYMAHHVGMSIIAILNAVKDNIFIRRFMADKQMGCANELLQEKIPIDTQVFENARQAIDRGSESTRMLTHTKRINPSDPTVALLSRGDMTVLISGNGHLGMRCGERILCNTLFDKYSLRFSPCLLFARGERVWGCSPLYGGECDYSFEQGKDFAAQIACGEGFSGRVKYSIAKGCNCLVINTRAEALKKYDITFAFEPVLDSEKNFRSHIAFSRLFLECEYDKVKRILYFHRRSREDGSHVFTLAVAPKFKDMNFSFLTTSEGLPSGGLQDVKTYALLDTRDEAGEIIDPLCLVRCKNAEGGRCSFLITCGESKKECETNIRLARAEKENYPLPAVESGDNMLPSLLYGRGNAVCRELGKCGIGDLWSKSISGDYPLAVVLLQKPAVTRTEGIVKSFMTLAEAFIKCELIFIVDDEDGYSRPAETAIRSVCTRLGADRYFHKRGGIFILRRTEIGNELLEALKRSAHYYIDTYREVSHRVQERPARKIITTPLDPAPLTVPQGCYKSGCGYFCESGYTVDKSKRPPAPYSYILTGYRFSAIITENSLGYTFFGNARERRLCSFFGDAKTIEQGERVLIKENEIEYDLCAVSHKVLYEKGHAIYYGATEDNEYTVTVTVHPKYPVKLIRIKALKPAEMSFEFTPVMGDSVAPVNGMEIMSFEAGGNGCLMFRNPFGMTFPEGHGFAGVCGGRADGDGCALHFGGSDCLFFIGACTTQWGAKEVASKIKPEFFAKTVDFADEFALSMIPSIKIATNSSSTDLLFNYFLPYQVAACRFYARGSFYQSGGAYGFRDQLQDSLALIYSNPMAVRTHIIRCCAHQYEEGDVMHWWHTGNHGGVNRGVRTKCSDDLLYLPIVVADYIEKTGDTDLLKVPVGYISSPPLGEKSERYEQPKKAQIKESVYEHCIRALNHADKRGSHGLILMGSCDWNDAFSMVGYKGKGESVFSSLLYIIAMERFIPICRIMGDGKSEEAFRQKAEHFKSRIEKHCFYGDRYARAICDDGTVLGVEDSEECKIDILSQAFAAMAGLDSQRASTALKTAFSRLYDSKNRIFKLFSPPFGRGRARVGYIRGYSYGIRENGGQYTHGVLWGALGCITMGMKEEGLAILDCANPANRYAQKDVGRRYKNEPYALSADVYSGKYTGRGGWSWYTGAAAWFYRITLEHILGIRLADGNRIISITPVIPFKSTIELKDAAVEIIASDSIKNPTLNGNIIEFPINLPKGNHKLEIPLK